LPRYNFRIDPETLHGFLELFETPTHHEAADLVVVPHSTQPGNGTAAGAIGARRTDIIRLFMMVTRTPAARFYAGLLLFSVKRLSRGWPTSARMRELPPAADREPPAYLPRSIGGFGRVLTI
jgi:hypothetical protein